MFALVRSISYFIRFVYKNSTTCSFLQSLLTIWMQILCFFSYVICNYIWHMGSLYYELRSGKNIWEEAKKLHTLFYDHSAFQNSILEMENLGLNLWIFSAPLLFLNLILPFFSLCEITKTRNLLPYKFIQSIVTFYFIMGNGITVFLHIICLAEIFVVSFQKFQLLPDFFQFSCIEFHSQLCNCHVRRKRFDIFSNLHIFLTGEKRFIYCIPKFGESRKTSVSLK